MKWIASTALLFAVTALIMSCEPKNKLSCGVPPGAVSMRLLAQTPISLQQAVERDLGKMASPYEDFAVGCIVPPGQLSRRLIFVWKFGTKWIVATERGGFAYNNPVLAYELSHDGRTATKVAEETELFPERVCETARRLVQQDASRPPRSLSPSVPSRAIP